jgi:hypothetical protein
MRLVNLELSNPEKISLAPHALCSCQAASQAELSKWRKDSIPLHYDVPTFADRKSAVRAGLNFVLVINTRILVGLPISLQSRSVFDSVEFRHRVERARANAWFPIRCRNRVALFES